MLFNKSFDLSHLENDSIKIPFFSKLHDVQPMCWMASNESYPSLKKFCSDYLHFKMIEFSEAAGEGNYNFGHTDPEKSFKYAAFDPVATVVLGQKMWNEYPYIRKIYPIDNQVTEACRLLGKEEITVDFDKVQALL